MYLPRSSCIICGEHITRITYNLKTTYSEKSKVLLITLVEKMYKNISFLHCNICTSCHDLLNELDTIQQREKELYSQLKQHISKLENCETETTDVKEFDVPDVPFLSASPSDYIQDYNEVLSEDVDLKIQDIDFKKLPVKIKRLSSKNNSSQSTSSPQSLKKSQKELADNDRAFEQIQSSIQMDLSKHVEEHLNKCKPDKNILCEICGQNFKTKSGYGNHLKKHDDVEDDMKLLALNKTEDHWCCDVCGKNFNQKVALARHVVLHTGETRYQCEECGKKFLHYSSFNMHRKIHAGKRNFKCAACNHCFLTNSHLKRHIRSTHDRERNHVCGTCGKKFAENYNLVAHIKNVHKEDIDTGELPEEGKAQLFYQVQGDSLMNGGGDAVIHVRESPDTVMYDLV